jgi:hypothetical protein
MDGSYRGMSYWLDSLSEPLIPRVGPERRLVHRPAGGLSWLMRAIARR